MRLLVVVNKAQIYLVNTRCGTHHTPTHITQSIKLGYHTSVAMETLDCFDLHDFVLNDDDDIQDAYCKLYNFCMKSLECSTKLKTNFKKVKLERDELIAKLDEDNNLNEKFKNQRTSHN